MMTYLQATFGKPDKSVKAPVQNDFNNMQGGRRDSGKRKFFARNRFDLGAAMKRLIAAAFASVLAFSGLAAGADSQSSTPMTERYSQRELLKNWTLSTCFAVIAKDQATKDDASSTASAYLEFGHQQMQVYQALRNLTDEFAAKHYSGSIPSEFNTMKCIDLYHSKELDQLVTKLLKTKFEPE